MKKLLPVSFLTICLVLLGSSFVSAQTSTVVAYVDGDKILSELPAKLEMDKQLIALRETLEADLAEKEAAFQAYVQDIQDKVKNGELSPKQRAEEDQKIKDQRLELQKEAIVADQELGKKEQELTQPIVDSFNAALAKVAQEKGYAYIVDKKLFLYLGGGIDATEDVKAAM